jgi:hypothetical protein
MRAINRTTNKDQELEVSDDGNLYVTAAAGGAADDPAYVAPATGAKFTVLLGNPTGTTFTSKAASVTSAALGGASTYTGGVDLWNSDTSIAIFVGVGTITAAAGANKVCLGPGQGVHWSGADVSTLHLISASGTPILSWIGNTL